MNSEIPDTRSPSYQIKCPKCGWGSSVAHGWIPGINYDATGVWTCGRCFNQFEEAKGPYEKVLLKDRNLVEHLSDLSEYELWTIDPHNQYEIYCCMTHIVLVGHMGGRCGKCGNVPRPR